MQHRLVQQGSAQQGLGQGRRAQDIKQPERARNAVGDDAGQCQCREGYQIALRNEDHAGDGEGNQQANSEQQIDGAGGQTILQQREKDRLIHQVIFPAKPGAG